MARAAGLPKTGGRKKGTPNKSTLGLQDALESHGLDVIGQLAEMMPQLPVEKRADVLINLMSYIYPKRKAVEQTLAIEEKKPYCPFTEDELTRILAEVEGR